MLLKKNHPQVVFLFFAVYLLIGSCIFKDYGISWDEYEQWEIGQKVLLYATGHDQGLLTFDNRYYGPAFEMFLTFAEHALRSILLGVKGIFFMRHFFTFLLFYLGTIFFYLLCKEKFQSWKMGLLGSFFLIFSPRIFADSFYNSKDIAFLSLFIISIYTLIRFLKESTYTRAVIHALISAVLIDVRIAGIILPALTLVFWLIVFMQSTERAKAGSLALCSYIAATTAFVILFWPLLWTDPIGHFKEALRFMANFERPVTVLYWGEYYSNRSLPWHYAPIWILITTPISYLVLFGVGLWVTIRAFLLNMAGFCKEQTDDILFILWFVLPLAAVILLRSALYDGWRHLFFIYPALLILALIGLRSLWKAVQSTAVKMILAAFIIVNLSNTLFFMVKYHPYQNVYFNKIAGRNMQEIKDRFDLDYWGLSYRKALEYILEHDHSKKIKIRAANLPGLYNSLLLDPDQVRRLQYVKTADEATYFLTNFRWHKEDYKFKDEVYSIKVQGAKIMAVYRIH